ncbi:MAG: metallopeptidase TldD-related protein, partial [Acidimicrobiales bacterium]
MSAGAAPSGEQLAELCRAALREARRHADEAEALAVHTAAGLTRFANSFIHQNVAEETVSLQLRVLRGGRTATASTTRLDAAGLAELATAAAAAANARPVDPSWPGFAPPEPAPDPGHWDAATADAGPDQRAALVAAFVAAGAGLAAAGYCDTEARTAALCSTTGHEVWGRTTRATIDGIQQGGGVAGSAHATSIRVADLDGAAAGELAAGRARRGLDAADLAPGEYEVVLEPECVATIAVFLGFEAFSAKAVAEGRSGIRLGEAAFDPAFALVDDARAPGSPALAFDAEG